MSTASTRCSGRDTPPHDSRRRFSHESYFFLKKTIEMRKKIKNGRKKAWVPLKDTTMVSNEADTVLQVLARWIPLLQRIQLPV